MIWEQNDTAAGLGLVPRKLVDGAEMASLSRAPGRFSRHAETFLGGFPLPSTRTAPPPRLIPHQHWADPTPKPPPKISLHSSICMLPIPSRDE